jgi:hypothetical protein
MSRIPGAYPRMLVLASTWRQRVAESVLVGLLALVAAGVLTAAVLAASATTRSGPTEAGRLGAPPYVADVPAATFGAARAALQRTELFTRIGTPTWQVDGTIVANSQNLQAVLLAGGHTPPWVRLFPGGLRTSRAVVYVERGAAGYLGVRAGTEVTIHSGTRAERVVVAGLLDDLSRGTYPLTDSASVVLDPAAASGLSLTGASATHAVIGLWTARSATVVQAALGRVLPADSGFVVLSSVAGSYSTIIDVVVGILIVFALAALVSLVLLVGAIVFLEVLRRERWVGQLRALGWSARGVRTLLALQKAPAVCIGATTGAALGIVFASHIAAPLTRLYGAEPYPWHPVLVAVAVLAVVTGAGVTSAMWSTRQAGRRSISEQLRGRSRDRPAFRQGRKLIGGMGHIGLALLAGRRRRLIAVAATTLVATIIAVLGGALSGAAGAVASTPAVWGFHYDDQVALPPGVSVATATAEVARLPGVAATSPVSYGQAQVAGTSFDGELVLTEPAFYSPPRTQGVPLTGGDEVEIGDQVRSYVEHDNTLTLGAGDRSVVVHVAAVVRDLQDQGDLILGTPALAARLASDLSSYGVYVRCASASACPAVGRELRAQDGGSWAVSSVKQDMSLPFAAALRTATRGLNLAFLLLAAMAGLYGGLATSGELLPTYGLLRAVGAARRKVVGIALAQAAATTVPSVLAGILLGVPIGRAVIGLASSSIGGLPVSASTMVGAAGAALVVGAVAYIGVAAPLGLAALRVPARSMHYAG